MSASLNVNKLGLEFYYTVLSNCSIYRVHTGFSKQKEGTPHCQILEYTVYSSVLSRTLKYQYSSHSYEQPTYYGRSHLVVPQNDILYANEPLMSSHLP